MSDDAPIPKLPTRSIALARRRALVDAKEGSPRTQVIKPAGIAPGPPKPKPKAEKVLPTDRIAIAKQVELVRAYGQSASDGVNPVTTAHVAEVMGINRDTASLANTFFVDTGLLARGADGFTPAPEVVQFARAYQFTPATAILKIAPVIRETWFAQALLPKLRFKPLSRTDALTVLADAGGAQFEHRTQLESLLYILENVGLIEDADGLLKATIATDDTTEKPSSPKQNDSKPRRHEAAPHSAGAFEFKMSVSFADIAMLPPEKISIVMNAIGELMKIKIELAKLDTHGGVDE